MAVRVAAIVIGMGALASLAQQPKPIPRPVPAVPPCSASDLLVAARAAVRDAPSVVQPALLAEIGAAEAAHTCAQSGSDAIRDLEQAFNAALALAGKNGDDGPEARTRYNVKNETERDAVATLGFLDFPAALRLASQTDTDRAEIYDHLLLHVALEHAKKLPAGVNVSELVRACVASTGTFPYTGMQVIVLNDTIPAETKNALIRESFSMAGDETDPSQISAAINLVVFTFDRVAWTKDLLLSVAPGMLRHLSQAIANRTSGASAPDPAFAYETGFMGQQGVQLLSAIRQLDATEANDLQSQFPQFAPIDPGTSTREGSIKAAFSEADAPPMPLAASDTSAADRFQHDAAVASDGGQDARQAHLETEQAA